MGGGCGPPGLFLRPLLTMFQLGLCSPCGLPCHLRCAPCCQQLHLLLLVRILRAAATVVRVRMGGPPRPHGSPTMHRRRSSATRVPPCPPTRCCKAPCRRRSRASRSRRSCSSPFRLLSGKTWVVAHEQHKIPRLELWQTGQAACGIGCYALGRPGSPLGGSSPPHIRPLEAQRSTEPTQCYLLTVVTYGAASQGFKHLDLSGQEAGLRSSSPLASRCTRGFVMQQ